MSVATAPRTRKPRQRPERRISLPVGLNAEGKNGIVRITETRQTRKGPAVKVDEYFLDRVPADYGEGFLIEKRDYGPCPEEEQSRYHVLLASGPDDSCECKGFLRHNHCRHIEGIRALKAAGKLS